MSEITHKPCPFTGCGSSDAFAYNTVKLVGHCSSCGRGWPSKEPVFDWAKEKYPTNGNKDYEYMSVAQFTPKRIEDTSAGEYVNMRSINTKTMAELRYVILQRKAFTPRMASRVTNCSV